MPNKNGVCFGIIVCLLIFTGCSQNQQGSLNGFEGNSQVEVVQPTPTEPSTAVPTFTLIPPSPTQTEGSVTQGTEQEAALVEWIPSAEAGNFLGQVIVVRVELSECAYKPNVNGSPTFCNDQPYPNHDFTYLMWGVDLSRFDQQCVLVTGEIVEYDGKAQIVLESEEQIIPCDG